MAEQNQERQKPRPIRRILKWLGVGLVSMLLILAVIYQAPWKVITLLAVFLAACTVLPKAARKWFWLSVGAVVLVLIIWVFLPEDDEGWRPYTFDAELAALEAQYAIPDEENAALLYDEILETLDTDSNQPESFLKSKPSSINEPWLSKDHPETAQWLKDHQDTIANLLQTARKDKCHFSIPADGWDLGGHSERLAPMRKCAFLLVSAGNNDIAEGRIDAGLEKYLCIIRMADHLYQQPVTIDFVVASGLERLALTRLSRFVIEDRPTAEQLQIVSDSARDLKNNWTSELKKMLEPDKLSSKNTFCSMTYEVNSQGKVRFSRDPLAAFRAVRPTELPKPTYPQRLLYKAKTVFAWLFMPSTPQQAAEILDARYDVMKEPDYDWSKQPQKFDSFFTRGNLNRIRLNYRYFARLMADLSEGSYLRLRDTYLRSLAIRRGSRVLIALKQYNVNNGRWPEDLDEIRANVPSEALIDPQNNNSYMYRLTEDDFRLYSKGANRKDEDGCHESDGPDDLAIWPPRSRLAESRQQDAESIEAGTDAERKP
jgi:hypothetical protein